MEAYEVLFFREYVYVRRQVKMGEMRRSSIHEVSEDGRQRLRPLLRRQERLKAYA